MIPVFRKSFKKLEHKNYAGAAKILEKLCADNESENKNIEYSYYSLGLCYYGLGNYEKALNWFSKSYRLYRQNVSSKSHSKYEEYRELVPLYCYTLERDGKGELAKVVESDLSKIR